MVLGALRLALLSTCLLLTAAKDPVTLIPTRVVVEYGASATANCSTDLTHIGIGWEAPVGAVDMNRHVSEITWHVSSLTEWNIELYCFINVNESYQYTKNLLITVYKIPDKVSITSNHTQYIIDGESCMLQCNIQDTAPLRDLVVKWYKGQTEIQSEKCNKTEITPQNTTMQLLIKPTASDDGAVYTCVAQLELGAEGPQPPPRVTSERLQMIVHYAPKFSKSVENFTETDKETILNCTVKANPLPKYIWDLPDQKGKSGEAILKVPSGNSGRYNCTAQNYRGLSVKQFIIHPRSRDRTTFWAIIGTGLAVLVFLVAGYLIHRSKSQRMTLNVSWLSTETPDSISISLVNHTGPMVEGKEYQLLCEVQNIAPVQYLTLRWYRGQTEVYNHTFSELSPATPVQVSSTLLVNPGRVEDGAPYRCEAALELGPEGPQPPPRVKSEPLSLAVHYPPDPFNPEREVMEFDDGEDILLNCSAGGNPPPSYSWSSPNMQDNDENQPLLKASSSGTYTCTASNVLGKSSKKFMVKPKSK
ncbi:hypothetical protein NFI96_014345, partial [Prochilodus magdalenae]